MAWIKDCNTDTIRRTIHFHRSFRETKALRGHTVAGHAACVQRSIVVRFDHMCMVFLIFMCSVCAPHNAKHTCITLRMQRHFGIKHLLRPRPKEVSVRECAYAIIAIIWTDTS